MGNSIGDILIIGAGVIGGTTGAILHRNNIDVSLINREGKHFDQVKSNGLYISNMNKYFQLPIFSSIKKLDRKFKHIMITTKNLDTRDAIKNIDSILTKDSLVYSMQNGFGNTEIIADYVPKDQIVACVVGWGGNKTKPGEITLTSSSGDFILGFENSNNVNDKRLIDVQKKLALWKPTTITDNIIGFRWGKLIVNSIIAPYGGLLGLTLGELFSNSKTKKLMSALKEEGLRVAESLNIRIEKVDNLDIRLFFYKPRPEDGPFLRLKNKLLSSIIAKIGSKRHGKIRSSLLWDLERNRKTEVDFLNGYITKKGKETGIETPINDFLVKAIHEIEEGKRKSGLHNLDELIQLANIE